MKRQTKNRRCRRMFAAAVLLGVIAAGKSGITAGAASSAVAINKKNFPDPVFRELVRVNYDKNKDRKLSAGEIRKAKKFGTYANKNSVRIKLSEYAEYEKKTICDIKSFKGVEKLINLRRFVANSTQVETVNFKKNTKLRALKMQCGNLKKLNLNKNLELRKVYLAYNQLSELKINKCRKLEYADVTGHMVKDLRISRNKYTWVNGAEYYTPFKNNRIEVNLNKLGDLGSLDIGGQYCVYEWDGEYASCVKKTLNGNAMTSVSVNLNDDTINKTKTMQSITTQWQDAEGNFYFIADKDGDRIAQTVNYLYKVDAQGAIVQEVKLNDGFFFSSKYNNRYHLYYMTQQDQVAVLKMTTGSQDNYGILYFDMNRMQITKQADCSFEPSAVEGDVIVGKDNLCMDVVVSKMTESVTAIIGEGENAKKIELFQLTSLHRLHAPNYYFDNGFSVGIKNNDVYMICGEGFYKATLTADEFTKLYGVGKIPQIRTANMHMVINSENDIVLLMSESEYDAVSGKTSDPQYTLNHCVAE